MSRHHGGFLWLLLAASAGGCITARLSRSGDAFPAPGDLEGTTPGVAEGARSVAVVIAKVRQ